MSKLNQNEDKSPAFASCHAPAWTVCPGTLRVAWAAFDSRSGCGVKPRSDLQIQPGGDGELHGRL